LYPETAKNPSEILRLLYECNPMAFIAEQAGGNAINGEKRIISIKPSLLHHRVAFYCGSRKMAEKLADFILKNL